MPENKASLLRCGKFFYWDDGASESGKFMQKKNMLVALFHCGFTYSGGGERIVLEQAKELRKRGYTVEIWAPTLDTKLCYPVDIAKLQVRTFLPQLPFFVPFRYALLMLASSMLAPFFAYRFRKIDIFIGENQPGAWIAFCMATLLKKPHLVYMNQPNRLLYPRNIDRQVNWQNLRGYNTIRFLVRHFRLLAAFLDRISFTSGKAMLLNGAYIGKVIEQIYGKKGVLCPAGTKIIEKKDLVSQKDVYQGFLAITNTAGHTFAIKRPFVLLTNRHVPQKKFDYGIEAIRILAKKMPHVQLIIPGSFTDHTKDLREKVQRLGLDHNITFLGQIPENELWKLYKNACVYVYTSPDEDFGMGVIEAMGAGVPVVAWNFAGPTVTIVSNQTGYLAKPYDVKDFANKLLQILASPRIRSKLSKNAWERAETCFSWKAHVDTLEKEITKALGK